MWRSQSGRLRDLRQNDRSRAYAQQRQEQAVHRQKARTAKHTLFMKARRPVWYFDAETQAAYIMWYWKSLGGGQAHLLDLSGFWGDRPLRIVERKYIPMQKVSIWIPQEQVEAAWDRFHELKEAQES